MKRWQWLKLKVFQAFPPRFWLHVPPIWVARIHYWLQGFGLWRRLFWRQGTMNENEVGRWPSAVSLGPEGLGLEGNMRSRGGSGWMVNYDGTGEAWTTDSSGVTTRRGLSAEEGRAMMVGFFGQWIVDEVMDPI